jgi:hypothetical protein
VLDQITSAISALYQEYGEAQKRRAIDRMLWLDREITGRDFIAGDAFSFADIIAETTIDFAKFVGIPAAAGSDGSGRLAREDEGAPELSRVGRARTWLVIRRRGRQRIGIRRKPSQLRALVQDRQIALVGEDAVALFAGSFACDAELDEQVHRG